MGLISIIVWIVYGIIVGAIASFGYRKITGEEDTPRGFIATMLVGIVGSFVGGLVNYLCGWGHGGPVEPSGFLMGICGGMIALAIYKYIKS